MNYALSDNSKKSYGSGQHQFLTFCEENFYFNKSGSPWPFCVLSHIKRATCRSDSLCSYISAIRHIYQMDTITHCRIPESPSSA